MKELKWYNKEGMKVAYYVFENQTLYDMKNATTNDIDSFILFLEKNNCEIKYMKMV